LLEPTDLTEYVNRDRASRLIDVLREATPAVRKAAADLWSGEWKRDFPAVRQAIAELDNLLGSA
jgi:hypothetical protein